MDPVVRMRGIEVPAVGFGTWELPPDVAERCVRDALELGYRHVDTAQIYGNEAAVGRALRDAAVDRDDVFLTTKIWKDDARAADVPRSAEASLDRLGVDHVDLLLVHWPTDIAPIEETVTALAELQERDLTRLVGVSNYTSHQLARAAEVAPIATNQVEYHPYLSQRAVARACHDHDVTLTAYSPLAHGRVIGDPVLDEIAANHHRGAPQVALRWLLDHPDVAVLPRSSNHDHIAANLSLDFDLTEHERLRIANLPKNLRVIDPPFAPAWDEG